MKQKKKIIIKNIKLFTQYFILFCCEPLRFYLEVKVSLKKIKGLKYLRVILFF